MNWKEDLKAVFRENGDDFSKMITTLSKEELVREFDGGYGNIKGDYFTSWGENFVYFPICYDGDEW